MGAAPGPSDACQDPVRPRVPPGRVAHPPRTAWIVGTETGPRALAAVMTPPAIPAATLVIFREAGNALPDLLMVERAGAMAFAGGAMVFPGGRVDPGDRALADASPLDPDDAAARIAAIRETLEEVGLPVGFAAPLDADAVASMRAALHAGEPFGAVLARHGAALALDRLVPFARWRPDHHGMRNFDTRFYLASLPADAPTASVDQTENVRLTWTTAADCLLAADGGELRIIFPTRRNLERLARFATVADAVADARAHPVTTITPWMEERDGRPHLCLPAGLGYPVTAEPIERVRRG